MARFTWLPDVLKEAGLKVALVPGWETRGRDISSTLGVICHHTVGLKTGNMPTLKLLINGRGGAKPVPGPLAQLGLGRDGTYFVVASGRANHAGKGSFRGVVDRGNENFIGIEPKILGFRTIPGRTCKWMPIVVA